MIYSGPSKERPKQPSATKTLQRAAPIILVGCISTFLFSSYIFSGLTSTAFIRMGMSAFMGNTYLIQQAFAKKHNNGGGNLTTSTHETSKAKIASSTTGSNQMQGGHPSTAAMGGPEGPVAGGGCEPGGPTCSGCDPGVSPYCVPEGNWTPGCEQPVPGSPFCLPPLHTGPPSLPGRSTALDAIHGTTNLTMSSSGSAHRGSPSTAARQITISPTGGCIPGGQKCIPCDPGLPGSEEGSPEGDNCVFSGDWHPTCAPDNHPPGCIPPLRGLTTTTHGKTNLTLSMAGSNQIGTNSGSSGRGITVPPITGTGIPSTTGPTIPTNQTSGGANQRQAGLVTQLGQ